MVTARGGQSRSATSPIAPAFRGSANIFTNDAGRSVKELDSVSRVQPAGRFSPLGPVGIGLIFLWDDVKTRSIQGS
jgi:hypothetical protein